MIDIKCGKLFPFPFLFLGAAIAVAGAASVMQYPLTSIALILVGVTVFTAHEGTEIDPVAKTYREYQAFLFMKRGKVKAYGSIEKIFVTSGKTTQKIYTPRTLNSSTFTHREYNAFLKFACGTKVFLASDRNKGRLLKRFAGIALKLNTVISDTTAYHPLA